MIRGPKAVLEHTRSVSELRRKELGQIRRAASVVELRMRLARGVRVLPTALTAGLAVTACTLALRKALPLALSNRRAWEIVLVAAAAPLLAFVVAMLRRLPARAGTVALDRHHGLADRLTNALAFDEAKERTPLMEVAIDDACERAPGLSPRKAAPIPVPRDLLGSVAVALGVAAVALLHVPPKPPVTPPQEKTIDAIALSPDDVELFRDAAKQMSRKDQSPEVKAAIDKFNQLIEDLSNKRLDRTEAFRRMEQIERELMTGAEADARAFEEALKQTAEELKKADLAKPLGESLEKKDLEKAKKDLKDLAASFKSEKKPDKAQLDRLEKALEKAAKKKKEALAAINEKRNEVREELLNKKKKEDPDAGAPSPEDERLLKKKERELEHLDREAEEQERAQRRLDKLDRELSKAAEDLAKDMGLSAQDLEQAAEDINRMQQEEMSDKEKEDLRQRLEELRELLRQQGQGGKERMKRMVRFGKRARGSSGKGQGQQGQGQQGEDQEGDDGDGKDGKDGKDGQGKEGQGGELVLGQGGKKILMLTKGAGAGEGKQGEAPGMPGGGQSGQSGQGPDGDGAPGKGIGTTHDPNLTGKRTDLKGGTSDVEEQGLDTKQGPSNSQVILSAAERGFKGSGYKKVFTQYHTVAEQEINKDQVPDGYRFYVHRYFQLIRPRE
jgi:hypothetical protein